MGSRQTEVEGQGRAGAPFNGGQAAPGGKLVPGHGAPQRQARDFDSHFWEPLCITAVAGREAPRCTLLI